MITRPYRLTTDDVERSSTLDKEDIGKWVYEIDGAVHGFTDTIDELPLELIEELI